jgi:methyl-accepting chemotaxis protein
MRLKFLSWSNIPIALKSHCLSFLVLAGLMVLGLVMSLQLSSLLEHNAETRTRLLVEAARGVITYFQHEESAGRLTNQQAKTMALGAIRTMRYDETQYFFVINEDGFILAHPGNSKLEGINIRDNTQKDGVNAFQMIAEAASNPGGAGFTRYFFSKPGENILLPKITYAMGIKPWNWILGTGNYVDDIAIQTRAASLQAAGIALLIGIPLGLVVFLLASSIVKPIVRAANALDRFAGGDYEAKIEDGDRRDEIGCIARGLLFLQQNARHYMELRRERENDAKASALVVESVAHALGRLSDGDLTCRVNETFSDKYLKIRDDFNSAAAKLEQAMLSVRSNTAMVVAGTEEFTAASADLAIRTEQQAANLEETAAALDEITTTVKRTADGSRQANAMVCQAKAEAAQSSQVAQETIIAMSAIERSSREINKIIEMIDKMALQTNLLSLNAAVEAARAGESGRGFAVVAAEIRSLAQQSAKAAKDIKDLISAAGQNVEHGVKLVTETGGTLERIVARFNEVHDIVVGISASAQEQAIGLDQINNSVIQMDLMTQQNAAMVEETNSASYALKNRTQELGRLIGFFELGKETSRENLLPPPVERVARPESRALAVARSSQAVAGKRDQQRDLDDWTAF